MFEILNYFSSEARRLAAAALYDSKKRYHGYCPIGIMLKCDGYVADKSPSGIMVANCLGKFPETDWEKILAHSSLFIEKWDIGEISSEELL